MSLQDILDPNTVAAVSSAIAAIFAAVAAYLSWRTQVHTLRHSFRPEITILGWTRLTATENRPERLTFLKVKNSGRDTAGQVIIHASGMADDNRPTYASSSICVTGLAVGEEVSVEGEIAIFWRNVAQLSGVGKVLAVEVVIWAWDALDVRHTTKYSLIVMEKPDMHLGNAMQIASGVYVMSQRTNSKPIWALNLRSRMRKVAIFGRVFRQAGRDDE